MYHIIEISAAEYRGFLTGETAGEYSIYQSPEWYSLVETVFRYRVCYFAIRAVNSFPLAVFGTFERKLGPFSFRGAPLRGTHTEFGGPCFQRNLEVKVILESLVKYNSFMKKASYYEYALDFFCDDRHIKTFEKALLNNSESFNRKTSIVDLNRTIDELWKSFNGNTRNMIRKAKKNGFETQICRGSHVPIKQFYSLLQNAFSKGASLASPNSLLSKAFSSVMSSNVFMIKATCKSAGTSYGIFLIDRDRLRYLSGSTDKAGLSGAANSLVLWDAIQIGKKMGLSTFDLGGIGIPSIDRFKRGSEAKMLIIFGFMEVAEFL